MDKKLKIAHVFKIFLEMIDHWNLRVNISYKLIYYGGHALVKIRPLLRRSLFFFQRGIGGFC